MGSILSTRSSPIISGLLDRVWICLLDRVSTTPCMFYLAPGAAFAYARGKEKNTRPFMRKTPMKKRQQFARSKQRTGRKDTRRDLPLSLYQRLSRSWVINALVIPLLISLFGVVVAFLLTHLGR